MPASSCFSLVGQNQKLAGRARSYMGRRAVDPEG